MNPNSPRWKQVQVSRFGWESEALDFVREALPEGEPYRAWSNMEFVSRDGSINEVDLLVLVPRGFILVEIKSRGGRLDGDAGTWSWTSERRTSSYDNPLYLANLKAKRLKDLLAGQKALEKFRSQIPFVQAVVFCSAKDLTVRLTPEGRTHVYGRDREPGKALPPGETPLPGIREFLTGEPDRRPPVDASLSRAIARALEESGIRQSQKLRRVGDYDLQRLIQEGAAFQDWLGEHRTMKTLRRIRIYTVPASGILTRETVQRAARREFQLLQNVEHPGILRAVDFTEHELGPAILFDHVTTEIRLDHYLKERSNKLTVDLRLHLLRSVAEALRYAHEKRLSHRALSPQSILVTNPASERPSVKLFSWQTGVREAATTAGAGVTGTEHAESLIEDASTVYLAPEFKSRDADGSALDVFSLGALAYRLFSGEAPAERFHDLIETLHTQHGLDLSATADGVVESLRRVVREATNPEATLRLSVQEFLEGLDKVEDELTSPADDTISDPLEAKANDRLQGGFLVKKRLGTGSTAIAFLVERGEKQCVLKLALTQDQNERLRGEAAVLAKLIHPTIVRLQESVEMYGRVGLLLDSAGDDTLAQRLRKDGRLSLDQFHRFGADLLKAAAYLEDMGVPHRDIKPENLGIANVGKDGALHVILFDFSLSRAPLESIQAGTRPYLEPFLVHRKPRRWDTAAERFAVAVVLHEMATGSPPTWGDGKSDPASLSCEVTIDADHLEPAVKEPLGAFFLKALRRNPKERFDNAHDMLWAFQKALEGADRPTIPSDHDTAVDLSALVSAARPDSALAELGLSTRALNALERAGALTVRDFLAYPVTRYLHLRGAGAKTRREFQAVSDLLRSKFSDPASLAVGPEATSGPPVKAVKRGKKLGVPDVAEEDLPDAVSVDAVLAQILVRKSSANATTEPRVLALLLGVDDEAPAQLSGWPSQTEIADHLKVSRQLVFQIAKKFRDRWVRNSNITRLREDVSKLLRSNGGVLFVEEAESLLLALRGSSASEPARSRSARAVLRAAAETERGLRDPRWTTQRSDDRIFVALEGLDGCSAEDLVGYAERLGKKAEGLCEQDPLPSPTRVLDALQEVRRPSYPLEVEPPSQGRLVRLAAAASRIAAVSSRLELYPRGLSASRALKLGAGALLGPGLFSADQLRERISSRYPDAEPLPERPLLDTLLKDCGLDFEWDPKAGGFRQTTFTAGASSSTRTNPDPAARPPRLDVRSEWNDARAFDDRLARAAREGAFLVLMTAPSTAARVEEQLAKRFGVVVTNVDRLVLGAMRDAAREHQVDWGLVLRADVAPSGTVDAENLRRLVRLAMTRIDARLASSDSTLLLTNPGLLVRYDEMPLIDRLRERVTQPGGGLKGAWILIPADEQAELPVLDGKPIPVLTPAQWVRVPEGWVEESGAGWVPPAEPGRGAILTPS